MSRVQFSIWVMLALIVLIVPMANSEEENVRRSLVRFMQNLSGGKIQNDPKWGWNETSDPCSAAWSGVSCDSKSQAVKKIVLEDFNFTGNFDASSVCSAQSLTVLSLNRNGISGSIPEEIRNCRRLTHLFLNGNKLSGDIPESLSQLGNLKRLQISNNSLSGQIIGLSRISGLISFLAENNRLSGEIPEFHFSNLQEFNVANNYFSGPIPDVKSKFISDSFSGNPGLCGNPLPNSCPPAAPPQTGTKSKHSSKNRFLIYSGYIILVLAVLSLIVLKLISKKKSEKEKTESKETSTETSSGESKTTRNRSEYSITSAESGMPSSSLVVLTSPLVKELKFEDLLRAPAELLGKGKHGSLYKVLLNDGVILTVKRIRDWGISKEVFDNRMQRIHQVKHPKLLSPVAFYCSKQEKLLVYEFHQNGSLFKLLHGSQYGKVFDWGSRLTVATIIAETLAFVHQEFREDRIAHGNLKSTNILFNLNMEPCISEYGLMEIENQDQLAPSKTDSYKHNARTKDRLHAAFEADVYGFGVILLELLTGKVVQNNGFDLAKWVHSVVSEEWTVEVFDKALMSEGASEERMVNLLQVALKCISPSPTERPTTAQIVVMINSIKEDEERSIISEP
ncbi:probable inactive receptor kinase At2g26730 [Mercurialis annua]|uniref:probable inactive receptor kinase At2g26730 n=1 Tax=Mercurialis annua TaxID=3986 RepID=UPI00215FB80E|nr:probable inactive receptor kinase At2g26730 [Mercurialis annua]